MEVRSVVPSKKQRLLLAEMVGKFHANQSDSFQAGEFLEKRGFTEDMSNRWKLGYVAEGQYRGRLAIPYWTPAGYSGMVFRCLHLPGDECKELLEHQKYLALPGYRPMFNVRALSIGADRVFVCEGELDAIAATAMGFPCVASGSATKWKEWWSYCFDGPREVVVLADGDEAGQALVQKVASALGRKVRGVAFPPGLDVCSLLVERGSEALCHLIEGEA